MPPLDADGTRKGSQRGAEEESPPDDREQGHSGWYAMFYREPRIDRGTRADRLRLRLAGQRALRDPDDYTAARRALEAGADGLFVPMVRSAADILGVLDAVLYPPTGHRGICPAYRAAGYSIRAFGEHTELSDAGVVVIPLIETLDALENIEEICALDRVRIIVFAAGELAFAMGEGAAMHSSTKVRDAYKTVKEAARSNGVVLLGGPILEPSSSNCSKALEDGIAVFCLGIDVMAFRRVCENTIEALNTAVGESNVHVREPAPQSGFPAHF